ncbi:MAG: HAD-IA family hydrolase [Clostridia bacterium]|nr:HAD-IA family hydrolase [Clostridia bacterium]
MSYALAIFDLDGTVLDTLDDLADATNAALARAELPVRTRDEVRAFVGNGIRALVERAVPHGTPSAVTDTVFASFREYYAAHCADRTAPYAGVPELVATLRAAGCRTAVLSNKADFAVQELCHRYFEGLFDVVAGERESAGIPKKPAPDGVYAICKELDIPLSCAVYIGDSEVDVATAQNAGLDAILVDWGFRTAAQLRAAGAQRIVCDAAALADAVLA